MVGRKQEELFAAGSLKEERGCWVDEKMKTIPGIKSRLIDMELKWEERVGG